MHVLTPILVQEDKDTETGFAKEFRAAFKPFDPTLNK